MIIPLAYDIEILPNFFSVTFISVNSYLKEFEDACIIDKKGKKKPIPLVQKYSVAEIKEKLNKVVSKQFYITDTDDTQLLPMIGFFNKMKQDHNNVRDIFGYNSMKYDKLMIAGLLANFRNYNKTKDLIKFLYDLSKKIISTQDNNDFQKNDYMLNALRSYSLPYRDIDLMRIFALNKVGKGIDSTGNTIFFSKSLKQTSINLQWYELLEYELPPISDIDRNIYEKLNPRNINLSNIELNARIDKWDRYIIDDWINPTMHYNKNDVFICCEIIRLYTDEINLRYNISSAYEIDVLNSSRSNIADKLFEKFYSEFSGLAPWQWKGKITERRVMKFKDIILPFIEFKTEPLKILLEEMKHTAITSLGKDSFKKEIKIGNLVYTVATGGLHSQDVPRELISKTNHINDFFTGEENCWNNVSDDSYYYIHWDISSFYPSLMVNFNVAPAHLDKIAFVKLIKWLRDTRVEAKHSKEDFIDGIPKDVLAQVLKIVINSIYGKLGYDRGDICDKLAVLNVTINGQLLILMLCEELELNGIEVMSANTDGIVVKLYKNKLDIFNNISNHWKEITKFDADAEIYKAYINRDINNYLIEETNGKISAKGALDPLMYANNLSKGYDMPIVAYAVSKYFLENKPIMDTLYEATNILDFCKTQNIGRQFHVEYVEGENTKNMQRQIRYYCAMKGGVLYKVDDITDRRNNLCVGQQVKILNTLDDLPIFERNINYQYYYNECYKIIDPIKLGISPNQKGNPNHKTKSGKNLIKKYSGMYNSLFDDND
jgi:hypothetical protein